MARLVHATLTAFRNYAALRFAPAPALTVLTGPNGSGKTNLLEALSLLAPGRGLRAARAASLPQNSGDSWAVATRIAETHAPDAVTHELGTGTPPEGGVRRVFRIDGAPVRGHAAVASLLPLVWLTPQMERLFGEAAGGRRRFLDRLVLALEPGHAAELAAHETAVQNRNRLLAERRHETAWLTAAEDSLARHAVAVSASRASLCRRLNAEAAGADDPEFPAARLALSDPLSARLAEAPAREVEAWLRASLASCRGDDAARGATSLGAHRADLTIAERASGLDAAEASTGQQKSLLIGIVLAHARLLGAEGGAMPLLLFDEPLVHLDARRRAALFARLRALGAQAIMTGTDESAFAPLAADALFLRTGEGTLHAAEQTGI